MSERILKHLPDYYRMIDDIKELDLIETIELDLLQGSLDQLLNDQFVVTADIDSIRRRERMLGIQADPSTETLEFRRRRILNRYQTKPPFTIRYLQQQLDNLVGIGMTVVTVDMKNFVLTVTTNIENASIFREIIHTIETIKPANLVYQQNTSLENVIELDEDISMQLMTWNYKLDGSWKIDEKPFLSLGSEVPIK